MYPTCIRYESNTALIVGSEHDLHKPVRRALRSAGFRVVTVENRRKALRELDRQPVHLVIVDISLQVPGGLELLRDMSEERPVLKRIAISANPYLTWIAELLGAHASLTKPVRVPELVSAISFLFGRPERSRT